MKSILRISLILMVGSLPAWAALGGDISSVNADAQVLGGQHSVVAKGGYTLHQITKADGSAVNEFVSPAGVVFGISWQGHFMPNLNQVLGSHLTDLQQGERTHVVPRRAVTIQTDDFVFTSFGHGHSFRGRAYVRSLVPGNLTPEVVQ
jgi:hypothetical protein